MASYVLSASSFSLQGGGRQQKQESSRKINFLKIVMGDGVSTYPGPGGGGGIPLAGKFLGCPTYIDSVEVVDNGSAGIQWNWDKVNQVLRAFLTGTAANTVLNEAANTFVLPVHSIVVEVKGY